jgi:hypothetical protein
MSEAGINRVKVNNGFVQAVQKSGREGTKHFNTGVSGEMMFNLPGEEARNLDPTQVGKGPNWVQEKWQRVGMTASTLFGQGRDKRMKSDDVYRHLLKQPNEDWAKKAFLGVLKDELTRTIAQQGESLGKYDEGGQIKFLDEEPGAGGKAGVIASTPSEDAMAKAQVDMFKWFPEKYMANVGKTVEQVGGDAFMDAGKDLQDYLHTLQKNDPGLWERITDGANNLTKDGVTALQQLMEEDRQMLIRYSELTGRGITFMHDKDMYYWFKKRGMLPKHDEIGAGEHLKMGLGVIGHAAQGVAVMGGQLIKEAGLGAAGLWGNLIQGKGSEALDEVNEHILQNWVGIWTDSAAMQANDWRILMGGFEKFMSKSVEGKELKAWYGSEHIADPERREEYREAHAEIERQYMANAMANKATWENVTNETALRLSLDPNTAHKMLLAGSFVTDLTNYIPLGGWGKTGAGAALKASNKIATKVAKTGAVRAAKEVSEAANTALAKAQADYTNAVFKIGPPHSSGAPRTPTQVATLDAAKTAVLDAGAAYTKAQDKYAKIALETSNALQEAAEKGGLHLGAHATKLLGQALGKTIDASESVIRKGVDKAFPLMSQEAKDTLVRRTMTTSGTLALGGAAYGAVELFDDDSKEGANILQVGATVLGAAGGFGHGWVRAVARDVERMGTMATFGRAVNPLHKQVLKEAKDGVIEISGTTGLALNMWDSLSNAYHWTTNFPGNALGAVTGREGLGEGVNTALQYVAGSVLKAPQRTLKAGLSREGLLAMGIQGTIGYIGAGGESGGFWTGLGMGMGFVAGGGVLGSFMPFHNIAEANKMAAATRRQLRETLRDTDTETLVQFERLTLEQQTFLAWAQNGMPGFNLRVVDEGAAYGPGSFNRDSKTIVINRSHPNWESFYKKEVMAHESAHGILANNPAMRTRVMQSILGGSDGNGFAGKFAVRGDDGKVTHSVGPATRHEVAHLKRTHPGSQPLSREEIARRTGLSVEAVESINQQRPLEGDVNLQISDLNHNDVHVNTTDQFKTYQENYLKNLNPHHRTALEQEHYTERRMQEYIAEEYFAESFANYNKNFSLKKARDMRRPSSRESSLEKEMGRSLRQTRTDLLARMGAIFDQTGKIESVIFTDQHSGTKKIEKLSKDPNIEALIRAHNHDVAQGKLPEASYVEGRSEFSSPDDYAKPGFDGNALKGWVANGRFEVNPATGIPDGVTVDNATGDWSITDHRKIRRTGAKADRAAKELGDAVVNYITDNLPPVITKGELVVEIDNEINARSNASRPNEKQALEDFRGYVEQTFAGRPPDADEIRAYIHSQRSNAPRNIQNMWDEVLNWVNSNIQDDGVVKQRTTSDGKTIIAGRYLPDTLLDQLESQGRFNPAQLENIRKLNDLLKANLGGEPLVFMYQTAGRRGRYASVRAAEKSAYVTGWQISEKGNLIFRAWDAEKIIQNGARRLKTKMGRDLYNGNLTQLTTDIHTYLNNHANGRRGYEGLGDRFMEKKDFIHSLLGIGKPRYATAFGETVTDVSPYHTALDSLKPPKNPNTALNSFRIDRTNWLETASSNKVNSRLAPLDRPLTSREPPGPRGAYQQIRRNYTTGILLNPEALTLNLGHHSPTEAWIKNIFKKRFGQKVGAQEAWSLLKARSGVRAESIWTGLDVWLEKMAQGKMGKDEKGKVKKSVTPEEMLEFLDENRVTFQRELLATEHQSGADIPQTPWLDRIEEVGHEAARKEFSVLDDVVGKTKTQVETAFKKAVKAEEDAVAQSNEPGQAAVRDAVAEGQYETYVIKNGREGSGNYFNILLHVDNFPDMPSPSHFGSNLPGYTGHLILKARKTLDGKKILMLEEAQNDSSRRFRKGSAQFGVWKREEQLAFKHKLGEWTSREQTIRRELAEKAAPLFKDYNTEGTPVVRGDLHGPEGKPLEEGWVGHLDHGAPLPEETPGASDPSAQIKLEDSDAGQKLADLIVWEGGMEASGQHLLRGETALGAFLNSRRLRPRSISLPDFMEPLRGEARLIENAPKELQEALKHAPSVWKDFLEAYDNAAENYNDGLRSTVDIVPFAPLEDIVPYSGESPSTLSGTAYQGHPLILFNELFNKAFLPHPNIKGTHGAVAHHPGPFSNRKELLVAGVGWNEIPIFKDLVSIRATKLLGVKRKYKKFAEFDEVALADLMRGEPHRWRGGLVNLSRATMRETVNKLLKKVTAKEREALLDFSPETLIKDIKQIGRQLQESQRKLNDLSGRRRDISERHGTHQRAPEELFKDYEKKWRAYDLYHSKHSHKKLNDVREESFIHIVKKLKELKIERDAAEKKIRDNPSTYNEINKVVSGIQIQQLNLRRHTDALGGVIIARQAQVAANKMKPLYEALAKAEGESKVLFHKRAKDPTANVKYEKAEFIENKLRREIKTLMQGHLNVMENLGHTLIDPFTEHNLGIPQKLKPKDYRSGSPDLLPWKPGHPTLGEEGMIVQGTGPINEFTLNSGTIDLITNTQQYHFQKIRELVDIQNAIEQGEPLGMVRYNLRGANKLKHSPEGGIVRDLPIGGNWANSSSRQLANAPLDSLGIHDSDIVRSHLVPKSRMAKHLSKRLPQAARKENIHKRDLLHSMQEIEDLSGVITSGELGPPPKESSERASRAKFDDERESIKKGDPGQKVKEFPFQERWLNLMVDHAIYFAAQNGFEGLSLVREDHARARYNLSDDFQALRVRRDGVKTDSEGNTIPLYEISGVRTVKDSPAADASSFQKDPHHHLGEVLKGGLTGWSRGQKNSVEEHIGGEHTQMVIDGINEQMSEADYLAGAASVANVPDGPPPFNIYSHTLSGDGLFAGGHWAKKLYGSHIPNAIKASLKKVGKIMGKDKVPKLETTMIEGIGEVYDSRVHLRKVYTFSNFSLALPHRRGGTHHGLSHSANFDKDMGYGSVRPPGVNDIPGELTERVFDSLFHHGNFDYGRGKLQNELGDTHPGTPPLTVRIMDESLETGPKESSLLGQSATMTFRGSQTGYRDSPVYADPQVGTNHGLEPSMVVPMWNLHDPRSQATSKKGSSYKGQSVVDKIYQNSVTVMEAMVRLGIKDPEKQVKRFTPLHINRPNEMITQNHFKKGRKGQHGEKPERSMNNIGTATPTPLPRQGDRVAAAIPETGHRTDNIGSLYLPDTDTYRSQMLTPVGDKPMGVLVELRNGEFIFLPATELGSGRVSPFNAPGVGTTAPGGKDWPGSIQHVGKFDMHDLGGSERTLDAIAVGKEKQVDGALGENRINLEPDVNLQKSRLRDTQGEHVLNEEVGTTQRPLSDDDAIHSSQYGREYEGQYSFIYETDGDHASVSHTQRRDLEVVDATLSQYMEKAGWERMDIAWNPHVEGGPFSRKAYLDSGREGQLPLATRPDDLPVAYRITPDMLGDENTIGYKPEEAYEYVAHTLNRGYGGRLARRYNAAMFLDHAITGEMAKILGVENPNLGQGPSWDKGRLRSRLDREHDRIRNEVKGVEARDTATTQSVQAEYKSIFGKEAPQSRAEAESLKAEGILYQKEIRRPEGSGAHTDFTYEEFWLDPAIKKGSHREGSLMEGHRDPSAYDSFSYSVPLSNLFQLIVDQGRWAIPDVLLRGEYGTPTHRLTQLATLRDYIMGHRDLTNTERMKLGIHTRLVDVEGPDGATIAFRESQTGYRGLRDDLQNVPLDVASAAGDTPIRTAVVRDRTIAPEGDSSGYPWSKWNDPKLPALPFKDAEGTAWGHSVANNGIRDVLALRPGEIANHHIDPDALTHRDRTRPTADRSRKLRDHEGNVIADVGEYRNAVFNEFKKFEAVGQGLEHFHIDLPPEFRAKLMDVGMSSFTPGIIGFDLKSPANKNKKTSPAHWAERVVALTHGHRPIEEIYTKDDTIYEHNPKRGHRPLDPLELEMVKAMGLTPKAIEEHISMRADETWDTYLGGTQTATGRHGPLAYSNFVDNRMASKRHGLAELTHLLTEAKREGKVWDSAEHYRQTNDLDPDWRFVGNNSEAHMVWRKGDRIFKEMKPRPYNKGFGVNDAHVGKLLKRMALFNEFLGADIAFEAVHVHDSNKAFKGEHVQSVIFSMEFHENLKHGSTTEVHEFFQNDGWTREPALHHGWSKVLPNGKKVFLSDAHNSNVMKTKPMNYAQWLSKEIYGGMHDDRQPSKRLPVQDYLDGFQYEWQEGKQVEWLTGDGNKVKDDFTGWTRIKFADFNQRADFLKLIETDNSGSGVMWRKELRRKIEWKPDPNDYGFFNSGNSLDNTGLYVKSDTPFIKAVTPHVEGSGGMGGGPITVDRRFYDRSGKRKNTIEKWNSQRHEAENLQIRYDEYQANFQEKMVPVDVIAWNDPTNGHYTPGTIKFNKWFNESKAVDSSGQPKVFYRGQVRPLEKLEEYVYDEFTYSYGRSGLSFTEVPEIGNLYAHSRPSGGGVFDNYRFTSHGDEIGSVTPVYLSMQNPFHLARSSVSYGRGSLLNVLDNANWNFYANEPKRKSHFQIQDLIGLYWNLDDPVEPISIKFDSSYLYGDGEAAIETPSDAAKYVEKKWEKIKKWNKKNGELHPEFDKRNEDFVEDINYITDMTTVDVYAVADTDTMRYYAERNGYDGIVFEDVAEGAAHYMGKETVGGRPIEEVDGVTTTEMGEKLEPDQYTFETWRPFKEKQIKSVWNDGNYSKKGGGISHTPGLDAKYQAALESGDMKAAAGLVEKAAKDAGYTEKVYHGTTSSEFKANEFGATGGGLGGLGWHYLTDTRKFAEVYGPENLSLIGKPSEAFEFDVTLASQLDPTKKSEKGKWQALPTKIPGLIVTLDSRAGGDVGFNITHQQSGLKLNPRRFDKADTEAALANLQRLNLNWDVPEAKIQKFTKLTKKKIFNAMESAWGTEMKAEFSYRSEREGIPGEVHEFFLKVDKPLDLTDLNGGRYIASTTLKKRLAEAGIEIDPAKYGLGERKMYQYFNSYDFVKDFREKLIRAGYDGLKFNDVVEDTAKGVTTVAVRGNQIKSAAVATSENGNPVPLSQRFNKGRTTINHTMGISISEFVPKEQERAQRSGHQQGFMAKTNAPVYEITESPKEAGRILDFGTGKKAIHAEALRTAGYDVTAYDFEATTSIHDPDALTRTYDKVLASRVLNVQDSVAMLDLTIEQLRASVADEGHIIANFPTNPRYGAYDHIEGRGAQVDFLQEKLSQYFEVQKIAGSRGSPIWRLEPIPETNFGMSKKDTDSVVKNLEPEGRYLKPISYSKSELVDETGSGYTPGLIYPFIGTEAPILAKTVFDENGTGNPRYAKAAQGGLSEAAKYLSDLFLDRFGEAIDARTITPEQELWLTDQFVMEAVDAGTKTENNAHWYTDSIVETLDHAARIFPELAKKEGMDYISFLGAIAITSQKMRVEQNLKGAIHQYEYRRANGKFDYVKEHGDAAGAVTNNLKVFDMMVEEYGEKGFMDFIRADFSVKELSSLVSKITGRETSVAGYQTDIVKGSAIFGPKIGQGFFQNLLGNYDPVTVDLWLRRTYGRLTGHVYDPELTPGIIGRIVQASRTNAGKLKNNNFSISKNLPFLLKRKITGEYSKDGKARFSLTDKTFKELFDPETSEGQANAKKIFTLGKRLDREWQKIYAAPGREMKRTINKYKNQVEEIKKEVASLNKEREREEPFEKGEKSKITTKLRSREKTLERLERQLPGHIEKADALHEAKLTEVLAMKPEWAYVGATIKDKLSPIDLPTDLERAIINRVFNVARKRLKDEHGLDYTNADLQALLWYPEKDIWSWLTKGTPESSLNEDYGTVMKRIADERENSK